MTTDNKILNVKIEPGTRVVFDIDCGGKGRVICHEFAENNRDATTSWLTRLREMSEEAQQDFLILEDHQRILWRQSELTVKIDDIIHGRSYSFAHRWKRVQTAECFPLNDFLGVWLESPSLREIEIQPDGICRARGISRGGKVDVTGEFLWSWQSPCEFSIEHRFPWPQKDPRGEVSRWVEVTHRYQLSRWDRTVIEMIVSRQSEISIAEPRIVWWKRQKRLTT